MVKGDSLNTLEDFKDIDLRISQYEIWLADLNPRIRTKSGKTRPVLMVQTDLLNHIPHPSTIICPLTTNIQHEAKILRVQIDQGIVNLDYIVIYD